MRQKSSACVVLALSFAGAITSLTPANAADVKMGYINKMGEHPWFVSEVAGAKSEAGKLGVNLMTQDVQFDANLALTTFDLSIHVNELPAKAPCQFRTDRVLTRTHESNKKHDTDSHSISRLKNRDTSTFLVSTHPD